MASVGMTRLGFWLGLLPSSDEPLRRNWSHRTLARWIGSLRSEWLAWAADRLRSEWRAWGFDWDFCRAQINRSANADPLRGKRSQCKLTRSNSPRARLT